VHHAQPPHTILIAPPCERTSLQNPLGAGPQDGIATLYRVEHLKIFISHP